MSTFALEDVTLIVRVVAVVRCVVGVGAEEIGDDGGGVVLVLSMMAWWLVVAEEGLRLTDEEGAELGAEDLTVDGVLSPPTRCCWRGSRVTEILA